MGISGQNQRSSVLDLLGMAHYGTQYGGKLKCLQTNKRGEFKSEEFVKFCQQRDIRREYMAPYSPEQNGISE